MTELNKTTIDISEEESWYGYKCPNCNETIMTQIKAYPGDWLKCNCCNRRIKIIGTMPVSQNEILAEYVEYKKLGPIDSCRIACIKQKEKLIHEQDGKKLCPVCKQILPKEYSTNYCNNCGQKLISKN